MNYIVNVERITRSTGS